MTEIEQIKKDLESNQEISISIKVKTNGKENIFCGISEDENKNKFYILQVKAQPIDGKANLQIKKYLSDCLDIPKSNINIIRGEGNSYKLIKLKK